MSDLSGTIGIVTSITCQPVAMPIDHLEVAHDHTLMVGAGQWVVHNCGETGEPDPAKAVSGQPNHEATEIIGYQARAPIHMLWSSK